MARLGFRALLLAATTVAIVLPLGGCGGRASRPTTPAPTEVRVQFPSGPNTLSGILALPAGTDRHPAIVLLSGSERAGAASPTFVEHARVLVRRGFAVLRYDPPGVGRSTGSTALETLDDRAAEAIAAVRYLRSRADIRQREVGLWGVSQGGWVTQMAAAATSDVAFVVSVSGSGVSPAEQMVYSVAAQSRAAGSGEEDVAKAVLAVRLLIDWQITRPLYRAQNLADARRLGPGPWRQFARLVYAPGSLSAAQSLKRGIVLLRAIQREQWSTYLYLGTAVLPGLEALPASQIGAARAALTLSYTVDPADYLAKVRCPLLAIWGAEDVLVPARTSAAVYRRALAEAGNRHVTLVVVPGADHSLNGFSKPYWTALTRWLANRYAE